MIALSSPDSLALFGAPRGALVPVGVGALAARGVGDLGQIFASQAQVSALKVQIASLLGDINGALVGADVTDPHDAALFVLEADQTSLAVRFDDWSAQTLRGIASFDSFAAEQSANYARFVALGGTPTGPAPAPPPTTLADLARWLPWVGLAVLVVVLAPSINAGVIAGIGAATARGAAT